MLTLIFQITKLIKLEISLEEFHSGPISLRSDLYGHFSNQTGLWNPTYIWSSSCRIKSAKQCDLHRVNDPGRTSVTRAAVSEGNGRKYLQVLIHL